MCLNCFFKYDIFAKYIPFYLGYGYCLNKLDSKNYHIFKLLNKKNRNKKNANIHNSVLFPVHGSNTHFMYELSQKPKFQLFQRPEVGSTILNVSKIIFLNHKYKILRMSDPRYVVYLYSGIYFFQIYIRGSGERGGAVTPSL